MRKFAILLILAVILPSLALAWLAVASLRDAQFVLERQQANLYQAEADRLAVAVFAKLGTLQGEFNRLATTFFDSNPRLDSADFSNWLGKEWSLAQVGFVVTPDGRILSPPPLDQKTSEFLVQNGEFLGNREIAEVYSSYNQTIPNQQDLQGVDTSWESQQLQQQARIPSQSKQVTRNILPLKSRVYEETQQVEVAEVSKAIAMETEFQQIVAGGEEGMLSRILQDKLALMFWRRMPEQKGLVAGVQLSPPNLIEALAPLIRSAGSESICVALLNERAKPAVISRPGFQTNWRRPFVAAEIGEVLPRWEIAVYLTDPASLERAAGQTRLLVGLVVLLLLLAIASGSAILVADQNRQLRLARQKSDFVSNVSHELKTPLTSIRMFSDMLLEKQNSDPEKNRRYLTIISSETARLTRLINNVLDFSRMERGEQKLRKQSVELRDLISHTLEPFRPGLDSAGFVVETDFPETPVEILADPDALAAVLVNLISNAEKYSGPRHEILIRLRHTNAAVSIEVMDRGRGVPPGQEEKIFHEFHRAVDTLDEGISGSGLGLTIARRVVEAHGGTIRCEPREGGGSIFLIQVPSTQHS